MERVLILLATYNGAKYLSEQLESVLMQKDVEVSILVRDDGSTDDTTSILERYHKTNKLEWYTGEHLNVQKGYFDLMKRATEYKTNYFAFCDQDDIWDSDKLSIALKNLKYSKLQVPALYYCGQRLVDAEMNLIENHLLNKNRTLKTRFVLSDFAGCTGVFNKALLEKVIAYEPSYMLMHDTWILKVCLCLGGNVFVDSNVHMNYRQHSNNTVGLGRSFTATIKQVIQYLNEYHVEMQMKELKLGYESAMIPEYKEIVEYILNYKYSRESREFLLDRKNIDFHNRGLNFIYWIKVVAKKL